MISALLGGIGLFLLGMTLMTNALKEAAGSALRDVLARYTGGPWRAFFSGAALTTMVQSSGATVVTTIGLVSAGLLGFAQAIGIVFGAAVGTTSSGWLVAFLGLRFTVSVVALPLVGIGALTHLLGRGRVGSIGSLIAGFGLVFVGIDTLQSGMMTLSEHVDLGGISGQTLGSQLLLIGIGVVMTIIMQSSSAAVATTLAAVYSGTVVLPQAVALVIGQNLGTTSTALLASIGAVPSARRTAFAHVLLNTFSGAIAFLALPAYLALLNLAALRLGFGPAEQIALFHTTINVVGVLLLMPFLDRYGRLISWLVPERDEPLTRYLDPSVRTIPSVGVEAARRSAIQIAGLLVRIAHATLGSEGVARTEKNGLERAEIALRNTRSFLQEIHTSPEQPDEYQRHLSVLHAIEHLERLVTALHDWGQGIQSGALATDREITRAIRITRDALEEAGSWFDAADPERLTPDLSSLAARVADLRREHRPAVMARTAGGVDSPEAALHILDAMRVVDRTMYHLWRVIHHLGSVAQAPLPTPTATEADLEAALLD